MLRAVGPAGVSDHADRTLGSQEKLVPRSRRLFFSFILSVVACFAIPNLLSAADGPTNRTYLHKDWQIQSSCEAKDTGDQISLAGFDAAGWHRADIPATVVGALVADKTYPDPDYAVNLDSFPGMSHSNKQLFANMDMPDGSPFKCSWWYRTAFVSPAAAGKSVWLHFLGINYRANIWVNGQKIADTSDVAGTYRAYEFNITQFLKPGKTNALALEILAPDKYDLGITWVDWNPTEAIRLFETRRGV